MNWTKWTGLLVLVLVLTLTLFLLSEYILKTQMGLGEPIVYESHPLWGYAPKPNARYVRFGDDVVSFNNVGTRSTSDWRMDGQNILFLGDSVTYGGSYIDDHQTFASLVCNHLADWSCHNAGVNAYGIINMVARSRYDNRVNDAPVRVFTFITGDFDRGLQKADTAHFILREPPAYFPALWEVGNFLASRIKPNTWFGKTSQKNLNDTERSQQQFINRSFALDILITEIERLKLLNKKFLLVHSPSKSELTNPQLIYENKILAKLQEKYSGNILMLSEYLQEALLDDPIKLFRDDVHYEEAGHRVAGAALSKRLSVLLTP